MVYITSIYLFARGPGRDGTLELVPSFLGQAFRASLHLLRWRNVSAWLTVQDYSDIW